MTSVDDVRRVLEGSPEPFAADPDAKRRGMEHFQPTALTISRDGAWEERRRFNEAVLDTGRPAHRLAKRFATVIAQEGAALITEIETDGDGYLDWDAFNLCVRRIASRAVLGDDARDDGRVFELLSKLMEEANGLPKERSEYYEPFRKRIEGYVDDPEPESLVGLFAEAPPGPTPTPRARCRTGSSPAATPSRSTPSAPSPCSRRTPSSAPAWSPRSTRPRRPRPTASAPRSPPPGSRASATSRPASRTRCASTRRPRCCRARPTAMSAGTER